MGYLTEHAAGQLTCGGINLDRRPPSPVKMGVHRGWPPSALSLTGRENGQRPATTSGRGNDCFGQVSRQTGARPCRPCRASSFFHNTKSLTSHFLWCHSGTIEAGWHILSIAALPHSFGLDFVTARSCDDPDKKREICRWGLFTTNRSKCIGPSSRIGS